MQSLYEFKVKYITFIQLQDNEGKENGIETDERKDDSIVYADLDKSAMSEGRVYSLLDYYITTTVKL